MNFLLLLPFSLMVYEEVLRFGLLKKKFLRSKKEKEKRKREKKRKQAQKKRTQKKIDLIIDFRPLTLSPEKEKRKT